VASLLADPERRQELVTAGRVRPAALGLDRAGSELVTALRRVADRASDAAGDYVLANPVRPAAPLSH
jgi:hypothetical protein